MNVKTKRQKATPAVKQPGKATRERKPDLLTPETALAVAHTEIALTLHIPGLAKSTFRMAWDIRSRLAREGRYPLHDPATAANRAGEIHNHRLMLAQLVNLLPAADAIALAKLAIVLTACPPDEDIFHEIRAQRTFDNAGTAQLINAPKRASKAVSRG